MNKKLLIVGNESSIHTRNLKTLVKDYFSQTVVLDNKGFSLRSPFKLIKTVFRAKKLLNSYAPSFIILYQIDVAAFFLSFINRKIPTLVVAIGSDVLKVADKTCLNKFMVRYVLKKGKYFNAGSKAIEEKMQKLAKKKLDVTIANLGIDDIVPKNKENIIYSNRLHKELYNIDKIIQAFANFKKHSEVAKNWNLVIAASGREEDLLKQVQNLGIEKDVKFVGWLDNAQNNYYYAISKVWVSLAASDSISISLLEAMSAGCFPVCYDVVALQGLLFDNQNAVIVKDFDENFFLRAVNLINDDVLSSNRKKAKLLADKKTNQKIFYSIFDKEFAKH